MRPRAAVAPALVAAVVTALPFLISSACSAQPAASEWPMFRRDARRTGLSGRQGTLNGTLSWSYQAGEGIVSSVALGTDGELYVGSDDTRLYSFTPAGAFLWSYQCGDKVASSPAIADDGSIVVGSESARILALTKSGAFIWSYQAADPVRVPRPSPTTASSRSAATT